MKQKKTTDLIISGVLGLFFLGLSFTPLFRVGELKVYDLFLNLKPGLSARPEVALLNVDDQAIAAIGNYPVPRDFIANSLISMSELGTRSVLLDSEFRENSLRGIYLEYLKTELPEVFYREMGSLSTNVTDLLAALEAGRISMKDLKSLIPQLKSLNTDTENALLDATMKVEKDYDNLLGESGRFNGHVFATITAPGKDFLLSKGALPTERTPEWNKIIEEMAVPNVVVKEPYRFSVYTDVNPAIYPVLKGMLGAGNVEQVLDEDGVSRRVDSFFVYKDKFYAHLGIAALLKLMGDPVVEVYTSKVVLKDIKFGPNFPSELTIPLDEHGRMLIHWLNEDYVNSFKDRQVSFFDLYKYEKNYEDIIRNIRLLDDRGALGLYDGPTPLLDLWDLAEKAKTEGMQTGSEEDRIQFRKYRQTFLDEASRYFESNAMAKMGQDIAELSRTGAIGEEEKLVWSDIQNVFSATKMALADQASLKNKLKKSLDGAIIIMGYTAQSATDFGVNPFDTQYPNVGTYANEVNTILEKSFLWESPVWLSFLFALPLALLLPFLFIYLSPVKAMGAGLGLLLGLEATYFGIFVFTGGYFQGFLPAIWLITSLIVSMVISFRQANAKKDFIQGAFGQYLSKSVIDGLIANPDKLKLGGEKKELTALFTDVMGFSTISEQMDPEDLVILLNEYLTGLSDIILDSLGTVDKYEGDAIMAFYGAPTDLADHAYRACLAAVDMKRLEKELNKRFLESKMTPSPLLTRIGLNTGEMVVGNMGTENKKNYTIMGNSVNLAARLEGVNKQYGTWILISENTQKQIGDGFLLRTLDRVRVVGINTPIRLFELVELKIRATELQISTVEAFDKALEVFEKRDFPAAKKLFQAVLDLNPEDPPSKIYLKRCQDYVKTPPAANWDGVYNLTSK